MSASFTRLRSLTLLRRVKRKWFILAIMLFSYAMRAVYIESCSMFVRGGVYRVVRSNGRQGSKVFGLTANVRLRLDWMVERNHRSEHYGGCNSDWARPLTFGHERRGEPGPGLPRNRGSQAQESNPRRLSDFCL